MLLRDRDAADHLGPANAKGAKKPGVYYLEGTKTGRLEWVHCPWRSRKEGAGIVVVGYEPGIQRLEMALIGFSGCSHAQLMQAMVGHVFAEGELMVKYGR